MWYIIFLGLFLLPTCVSAQRKKFTVLEYNVENLYDTLHDDGKDDYEFLPSSERQWTGQRYWKKLGRLAIVIAASGYPSPPDLIGLCEVENDSVLYDLTQRTRLRKLGYQYLITESNDPRGIDVALVYHPMRFQLKLHESLHVFPPTKNDKATRDILYAVGQVPTGDVLHVLLCHLPSRSSGRIVSDIYRRAVARVMRQKCDEILNIDSCANILIMGDFNDEVKNASIQEELQAIIPREKEVFSKKSLYVLSNKLHHPNGAKGTYKYRGEWNQLDHFIVSGNLLNKQSSFRTAPNLCEIFCPNFLVEEDKSDHTIKPKRTYLGSFYRGGCSDHLPLRLQVFF